jgi:hypothetical protein
MTEPFFSLDEGAQRLSIGVHTLKRRIREARLHLPRPGRSRMFTERDFQLLVDYIRTRGPNYQRKSSAEIAAERALAKIQQREANRLAAEMRKGAPTLVHPKN